jgi:hypothetical protein
MIGQRLFGGVVNYLNDDFFHTNAAQRIAERVIRFQASKARNPLQL